MPANIGPPPGKPLDRDTTSEVNNWLAQHSPQKPLRMMAKIDHIRISQDKDAAADAEKKWTVSIMLANEDVKFRAIAVNANIQTNSIFGFQLQGDEAFAKRMEALPKGRPVRLEGVVRSVLFTAYVPTKANLKIVVDDFTLPTLK